MKLYQVTGLSNQTTWQRLKDWARAAGKVEYSVRAIIFMSLPSSQGVWRDDRGNNIGSVKFLGPDGFKNAPLKLNGSMLDGVRVRVEPDDKRSRAKTFQDRSSSGESAIRQRNR